MAASTRRKPAEKRSVRLLNKLFGWSPLYKMAIGGYRYYNHTRERRVDPGTLRHFGKHARIAPDVEVYCPERLWLGEGASIEANCSIHAVGGFHLGDYSGMAPGCRVITTEHRFLGAEEIPFDRVRLIKPVWIEDYVWIGANVSILPGVRIGRGAVIGLGSVVRVDVPPMAIVSGNPSEIVGYRDRAAFERLEAAKKCHGPDTVCSTLWVPPFVRRKYKEELAALGIDLSDGQYYFEYDRDALMGKRLRPLSSPPQK